MILFSRIVVLRNFLPNVMAITAIGMEALTVNPALRARYTVAAPNITPKRHPVNTDLIVSSFILTSGATKGRKFFWPFIKVNYITSYESVIPILFQNNDLIFKQHKSTVTVS